MKGGAHIVVGTPGRLIDHLKRGNLKLGSARTVILDEADRMLDMGFRDDMETILSAMPKERQSLFFSATMNRQVEGMIRRHAQNPQLIEMEEAARTVSTVDQSYYEVRGRSKVEVVSRLLDVDEARLAIIFCNTKRVVDECTEALLGRGYSTDRLHGDISQHQRERAMKSCRDGGIEVLVATDVAARGIDIDESAFLKSWAIGAVSSISGEVLEICLFPDNSLGNWFTTAKLIKATATVAKIRPDIGFLRKFIMELQFDWLFGWPIGT